MQFEEAEVKMQFEEAEVNFLLPKIKKVVIIILFKHSSIITWNGEKMVVVSHLFLFIRKKFQGAL